MHGSGCVLSRERSLGPVSTQNTDAVGTKDTPFVAHGCYVGSGICDLPSIPPPSLSPRIRFFKGIKLAPRPTMPGEMRCEEEEGGEGEDGKAGERSRVTAADEGKEESQLPGGRAGLEEWGEETTAAPSSGAPRVILPANQLYGDVLLIHSISILTW